MIFATGHLDGKGSECEHPFVSLQATILHADLDSFYASVEQRDDPRLRGRPVIVGGGVVLAASYEAKAYGVRTAMGGAPGAPAVPLAVVVPPRMSAYSEASKAVFEVFDDTTPFVEGISIDEAFLDVRGMQRIAGSPAEIAVRLRSNVLARVGLPITVGVARTKFLAKVASGVAKPDGLLVVPPERELAFLHPLPVERLWGVGAITARKLHERGTRDRRRGGRSSTRGSWWRMLGRASGRQLHALAHNRDASSGAATAAAPIHRGAACARPPAADRRLRSTSFSSGSSTASRAACALPSASGAPSCCGFASPTSHAQRARTPCRRRPPRHTTILAAARELLATATPMIERQGLTLVGIAVCNLENDDAVQLALPFDSWSGGALDAALDEVRERFGSTAVTRAVLLGRDQGFTVPMLPD